MLEKALTQITKLQRKELHLVGAGRTDAGVHAWGQVRLKNSQKSLPQTLKIHLFLFLPGSSFYHTL